jgi:peptide/nickel transport system substrate-binding protein
MDELDRTVLAGRRVTRRTVLKFIGATAGALGATGLLAACGGDDDDDDDAAEPTSAPAAQPTATTAAGTTPAASTPAATAAGGTTPAATTPAAGTTPAAATTPAAEGQQGGTLILGYGIQQLLNLDPPRVQAGIVAGELVSNLFSSLVQFDESLAIMPDLAEDWEITADGLEYTFNLREGLTFHNGDPLVADDLVYTYERTKSEELASPHANKLLNVTTAEAVDELTFKLTFSAPFGPFLATSCSRGPGRALTPISKRAVDEIGLEEHNLKPVGCGPFMLLPETMDPGTGFEMVAFENWYAGRPLLDKIVVQFIPEPSSRVSALEAGDVDMLDIVPVQGVAQLEGVEDVELVQVPGTNWIGLQINVNRPPWDNLDARMAVAKAIDKQEFIDTARFGLGTPSVGALAPAFGWAYIPPDELGEVPQAFDLDAANALAESSGIVGTQPILIAGADDPRNEETIRLLLSEIGVEVQLDLLQDAIFTERWEAGDYDFAVQGSVVDADPDDNAYNFFHSTGPWNTARWNSPEADALLDAERASADQEERAKAFQDLQMLGQQQAPFAFLYHAPDITGFHSYVKGYRPIPEMRYLETVWLDK